MEYWLYRFSFKTPVHFGNKSQEDISCTFGADTLFSALCIEALKQNKEYMEKLLEYSKAGRLLISDAFPYIKNVYYLPKPMLRIESDTQGDSVIKKAYKNLAYIEADNMDLYLSGQYNVLDKVNVLAELGTAFVKVSATIRNEDETKPYHVGTYTFAQGNGLYVIAGYEDREAVKLFEQLLKGVSLTGIGGRRSSGMGRFEFERSDVPEELKKRLAKDGNTYMTLSSSLPKEDELDKALESASYLLERKSGFVFSQTFSKTQLRKKDLYVFKSGSCFQNRYEGDIYDVSAGKGKHPVYRYAKPLFMEAGV